MTAETLVLPPRPPRSGTLPDPGTYRAAPGRCIFEISAGVGPLTTLRGRCAVLDSRLVVEQDERRTRLTIEASSASLRTTRPLATRHLTGRRGLAARQHRTIRFESSSFTIGQRDRLTIPGALYVRDEPVAVTLRTRAAGKSRDRLLIIALAELAYSTVRAGSDFRLPWSVPAGRIRLLIAADFR